MAARICWSLYELRKHNKTVSLGPNVSTGIYYRMMILGCVDAIITLPLSIFLVVTDLNPPPTSFYPGWDEVHANFSTIPTIPASEWEQDFWSSLSTKWDLWCNPISAVPFFALFGLNREVRAVYRSLFWKALSPFGFKKPIEQTDVFSEMKFGSVNGQNPTDGSVG